MLTMTTTINIPKIFHSFTLGYKEAIWKYRSTIKLFNIVLNNLSITDQHQHQI